MAEEKAKKRNPAVKQWIIPIAVLVVICLVCGALLALLNDLLYIDDDTRLSRSMQKVYPDFKLQEDKPVDTSVTVPNGRINRVLLSTDGTYVIEALGTGGFQGGSVTLYVVVGADALIKGWAVKENDKQSYIDRIPSDAGTTWYVGKDISNELPLEMTGATVKLTSTAINNSINAAAAYCRSVLGLGEDPEGDAKAAVIQLLTAAGYSYTVSNATKFSGQSAVGEELNGATDTIKYIFIVSSNDGMVIAYVYGEGEDIKIVAVEDGEVVAKSDNVTGDEDFVANVLAKPIVEISVTDSVKLYTFISDITTEGGKQVYTVVGLKGSGYDPNDYTLTVTIENGVVADIAIVVDGWVEGHPERVNANVLATALKGATLADIDSKYTDNKVAEATQSANIIMAAVKAALIHFDANFASNN